MKLFKHIFNFLRRKKKFVIPAVIIVVILFIVFGGSKKAVAPQYATAKKQDIKQEVSASGILTGKDSANLHFKSGGKLAYINVKTGDTVYKGQTIAGLDTQELEIALRQAESNFRDKKAIADKIHDDLKDVGSSETYAQRQTRTTAEVAQDNAYDSLLAAQRAFQDAVISSPIAGTITKADPIPGQIVSTTDVVAQVVDFSEIVFETDVDEADISKVSVGQKAEITLNAYGDKVFEGKVTEIVPQTKTTSNGATVVTVKIGLDDNTIQHIAGLNGETSIIQDEAKNVLAIPVDAIVNNDTVYVKTKSGLRSQKITPGFKNDSDVEVIHGLNEGDEVITNPLEVNPNSSAKNPLLRLLGAR